MHVERRGEFPPPRAVDIEIERGGGENPSSRRGCRDREGRASSCHGYQEQGEEGRTLPSSRRGCQDRERRRGKTPPHAVVVEIERGESPRTVDIKNKERRREFSHSSCRGCRDRS